MQNENDGEIVSQILDLGEESLDEVSLASRGFTIKAIMRAMFGGFSIPMEVRGNPSQIATFATALGKEKAFMEAFSKYGLDNPRTYKRKADLDSAVRKFESVTKIKWPFK
tara:strand:- start:1828 stop:2157 length:330 start_codon:yes stop_codon:yes gene_type:complete